MKSEGLKYSFGWDIFYLYAEEYSFRALSPHTKNKTYEKKIFSFFNLLLFTKIGILTQTHVLKEDFSSEID